MNFKQWLEEDGSFAQPADASNAKLATNLANRVIANNPSFTGDMASADNTKQKMDLVGKATSQAINKNKNAVRQHGLKPGVISKEIAQAGGMDDYEASFMKKGMKKK